MHLGLNLLFLVPGRTGGRETYVVGLLPQLRALRPGLRVTAFVGGDGAGVEGVDRVVRLRVGAGSRTGWALGETGLVAVAAARAGVDLLHSPANLGPAWGPFARVLTVHDVGWRTEPGPVSAATDLLVRTAARRAHRVIAVSRTSAEAVIRELGVPAARVAAVHNGIAAAPADEGHRTGRTVLCVATDVAHKDLDTAVAAHAALPEPRPPLRLVGHGTQRLGGDGAVPAAQLEARYREAGVLVVPSRYEGFGLPVLEAFARGVPVVCSDLPVLREIAGDLATFVPAGESAAFAAAIARVLADPPDAARLRAHAARYTWRAAAAATLAAYDQALRAASMAT